MTELARDRLAGGLLLLIAAVWIGLVLGTFPEGMGGNTSASTFPLASGIALAVLSVILIAGTFLRSGSADAGPRVGIDALEWRGVIATFGFLVAYIVALKYIGFVLGTVIVLAAFLYFVLGKRSPRLLIG